MLNYLWQHVDEEGRDRSEIDVCFGGFTGGSLTDDTFDADAQIAGLAELSALGVTWASVTVPGDSINHATEALQRYGTEVIATAKTS